MKMQINLVFSKRFEEREHRRAKDISIFGGEGTSGPGKKIFHKAHAIRQSLKHQPSNNLISLRAASLCVGKSVSLGFTRRGVSRKIRPQKRDDSVAAVFQP